MNALLNLEDDPHLSILLALEALAVSDTSEAEAALHQAVQASRVRLSLSGPDGLGVSEVVYSPDGRHLFASGSGGGGALWNAATGEYVFTYRHDPGEWFVNKVAFSLDGSRLATSSLESTAKVWEFDGGEVAPTPLILAGHKRLVAGLSFSPDGRRLASGSADGTARIWDISANGAGEFGAYAHDTRVIDAEFSPDGRMLVTSGFDGLGVFSPPPERSWLPWHSRG